MDLDFHPGLPLEVRVDLAEEGRAAGVPLWQLELLGQDEVIAEEFTQACRQDRAQAYLEGVEWDLLEARYQDRQRREEGPFWRRPNMTPSFPELLPHT
jgi:hypothetical protein